MGWLADLYRRGLVREAERGTTGCEHKGDLTDEDVTALLCEYSMGSDHERHLFCAGHANRVLTQQESLL